MNLTVITPPDALPVSLAEMKDHLRLGHDGEDALVSELIAAATSTIEQHLGTVLVARTLERCLATWPKALSTPGVELMPGPVISLLGVTLRGDDIPDEDVTGRFRLTCGRLVLRPWSIAPAVPMGGHAAVVFEAGFGAPGDVPDDLKLAVKLLVAEAYLARGTEPSGQAMPDAARHILETHRRVRL